MAVFAIVAIAALAVPTQSFTVAGCVPPRNPPKLLTGEGATLTVHVPNMPIASIAGGLLPNNRVIVNAAAAGGDPAYWKPTAEDIGRVQRADVIVLNGAGYEPWAAQAALPRARTLELSRLVEDRLIAEQGATHSHGPEGEHSHSGTAFTTWLSPAILRVQAGAIAAEFVKQRPSQKSAIEARLAALDARIVEVEAALKAIAAVEPRWLGSHPVYQYLAQAGGLTIDCVHWEPGETPLEIEWDLLRRKRAEVSAPRVWMLWEDEPLPAVRDRLRAEGVEVIVFSPLGAGDGSRGDFVAYLKNRVDAMRAAVAP